MTTNKALALYRSILRLHNQKLPLDLRLLGTTYLRTEFRAHRNVTNEAQLKQFFAAWEGYATMLKGKETLFGKDLSKDETLAMNEEQKEKLKKLQQNPIDGL